MFVAYNHVFGVVDERILVVFLYRVYPGFSAVLFDLGDLSAVFVGCLRERKKSSRKISKGYYL